MPPETARKLDAIYELTKENNRMLHKMRRAQFWGRVWHFLWILIVLGAPIALYYYFLQPYVEQLLETYGQIQSGAEQVQNFSFSQEFQDLLNRFGVGN